MGFVSFSKARMWEVHDPKRRRRWRFYRRYDSPYDVPPIPHKFWIEWEDTSLEPTIVRADKVGYHEEGMWLFYLRDELVECAAAGGVAQIVNATINSIEDISQGVTPPL